MIKGHIDGGFELRLTGFVVSRCIVDFAFSLDLTQGEEKASIRIETPFDYVLNGTVKRCDPAHNPESLGSVLGLFRRKVEGAFVSSEAHLQIVFEGAAALSVPNDPNFESWTFTDSNGGMVIAGPSNRISVVSR